MTDPSNPSTEPQKTSVARSTAGMSLAISMHRCGGQSKRAKREADKRLAQVCFAGFTGKDFKGTSGKPPPTPAETAARLRTYARMAGGRQAKKLIAQAEELERQGTEEKS